MTKEDILHYYQDINFYYNDCMMYDNLSNMLDELIITENRKEKGEILKGYISIEEVMSVFDDFMRGEVDEDEADIFREMLKDKLESEEV